MSGPVSNGESHAINHRGWGRESHRRPCGLYNIRCGRIDIIQGCKSPAEGKSTGASRTSRRRGEGQRRTRNLRVGREGERGAVANTRDDINEIKEGIGGNSTWQIIVLNRGGICNDISPTGGGNGKSTITSTHNVKSYPEKFLISGIARRVTDSIASDRARTKRNPQKRLGNTHDTISLVNRICRLESTGGRRRTRTGGITAERQTCLVHLNSVQNLRVISHGQVITVDGCVQGGDDNVDRYTTARTSRHNTRIVAEQRVRETILVRKLRRLTHRLQGIVSIDTSVRR